MSKRRRRSESTAAEHPRSNTVWRSEPSGPLFHYTTAAGLTGIVTDQVLWATHANYLNDTAELQILSELLGPQISSEFRDAVPKFKAVNAFKPGLLETYGESIYDTEAKNVCGAVMRTIESVAPIYVTSFCMHPAASEESEHGLLSQWRGYGRGGFAIENKKRSLQMIATRKVAYRNHEKVAELNRFEGLGLATLSSLFRETTPNLAARPEVTTILSDKSLDAYILPFIETVPFLKTRRFEEEQEYRLVASATRQSLAGQDSRSPIKVYFREGAAGALVPYIKLFETLGAKLPIKKIIVGPHRNQENQYNAARLLLDQNGIDAPVLRSDTSLRF